MAAFNANRLVWPAIPEITFTISPICRDESANFSTAPFTALLPAPMLSICCTARSIAALPFTVASVDLRLNPVIVSAVAATSSALADTSCTTAEVSFTAANCFDAPTATSVIDWATW